MGNKLLERRKKKKSLNSCAPGEGGKEARVGSAGGANRGGNVNCAVLPGIATVMHSKDEQWEFTKVFARRVTNSYLILKVKI